MRRKRKKKKRDMGVGLEAWEAGVGHGGVCTSGLRKILLETKWVIGLSDQKLPLRTPVGEAGGARKTFHSSTETEACQFADFRPLGPHTVKALTRVKKDKKKKWEETW